MQRDDSSKNGGAAAKVSLHVRGPAAGEQEEAGPGEEPVNIPWHFGIFCGENIYKGMRIWYLIKMDGVCACAAL